MMDKESRRNQILNSIRHHNEVSRSDVIDQLFSWQYDYCVPYRRWCDALSYHVYDGEIAGLPYLPIECFIHHEVVSDSSWVSSESTRFLSSGTTGSLRSVHLVRDLDRYLNQCMSSLHNFRAYSEDTMLFALLPSYIEQGNSSLVAMIDELSSRCDFQGYYLKNLAQLRFDLSKAIQSGNDIWLWGVTYAVLDLAKLGSIKGDFSITYTGGMKGRKKEMTPTEITESLVSVFPEASITTEYGMTELNSQAYGDSDGWLSPTQGLIALVAELDDPLRIAESGRGRAMYIDMHNLDSCSFIASQDLIDLRPDGTFKVLGRVDHADTRGCSLMYR